MSQRERERDKVSERERERAWARKGKGKGKKEDTSAGDFINKPPGLEWKIRELYCTLQERAALYVQLTILNRLANWYVRKICMILVGAVCRPAGQKKISVSNIYFLKRYAVKNRYCLELPPKNFFSWTLIEVGQLLPFITWALVAKVNYTVPLP